MQKERLTKDRILHDLHHRAPWWETGITAGILLTVAAFCGIQLYVFSSVLSPWITAVLTMLIVAIPLILIAWLVVSAYKTNHPTAADNYCLHIDQLQSAEERLTDSHCHRPLPPNWVLTFATFGMHRIFQHSLYPFCACKHYTWSKELCMSSERLYTSSLPGDTFYVVTTPDHKTVLEVYNTRFFVCEER